LEITAKGRVELLHKLNLWNLTKEARLRSALDPAHHHRLESLLQGSGTLPAPNQRVSAPPPHSSKVQPKAVQPRRRSRKEEEVDVLYLDTVDGEAVVEEQEKGTMGK
jgi:hypothetical protein